MRPDQIAVLLGRTPVFGGLGEEALHGLAASGGTRFYRKGQIIFYQGEPGDSLFVVADGLVKLVIRSEAGDEIVLTTLHAPDIFGELALIDGGPRSASAEALEPTTLVAISRSTFLGLLRDHPFLAEALLKSLGILMREALARACNLVFLDLQGRVAKRLLELAEVHGQRQADGIVLDLGVTQADFAAMVGGSRPTVNQILRAFEERGYLATKGRKIVLKSPDALRRRASG